MPLTKSQRAQALEHILTNVFDLEAKDPLRAALRDNGFVDICDLVNMKREHVENLAYLDEVDGTQQRVPIPWGKQEIINVFRDYIIYRHEINEPIGINCTDITMEQFNKFRIDPNYLKARILAKDGIPSFKTETNPPAPTTPVMTNDCTPANKLFQKEIKRDQSLYPILKTEQPHDSCDNKFEVQAHAQGIAHVVVNKYLPTNPDEEEVFKPIQTFMDAVLESKVHTPKGKEAIREHEATKDAPAAYANLVEHHRKSTAADIEAMKTNITTTTISDGKFKGTASEFLTNWTKQLKPYGNLTGNDSVFGEIVKVVHLSQASATVSELRQVKLTIEVLRMSTKNPIDFQQYCRLLSAAAVQYEDYLTHEDDPWDPGDLTHEDDSWDPGDSFDIDTPVYRLEAKAHMSRPRNQRGPSMGSPSNRSSQRILIPKEVWHTLGDDFKVAWSNLSEEEKAMIFSTGLPSNNPRVVQLHERSQDADMEEESQDAVADSPVEPAQSNDQVQVHNAQQQSAPKFPPYDIRAILSSKGKQASTLQAKMCITSTPVVYRVSSTYVKSKQSLVDRGANGGIAGQDCKVICVSDRTVDVQGIDNHQLNLVSIGTAAGYAESNKGPVILILHQYALVGRGHSIHSPGQLEWFKHSVCDKSVHVGGLQWIKTADGHTIPIAMVHSLPRVRMRPPTDKEFDTLPHIMMTSDTTWGPAVLDFDREEEDDQWFDAIEHQEAHPYSELFDEYGNYRRCVTVQLWDTLCHPSSDPQEHLIDQCIVHANCERELFFFDAQSHSINETSPLVAPSTPRMSSNSTPDFEKLRPMFGWISIETIKRTFQHTTQLARTTTGTLLKKVYRSQNPALNVIQRGEPVATDVVSSDTPAVDCGATRCQVSVGMNTDVTNIYPFQTSKQFVHLLEDNVRFWGAPTKLEADCAPTDISGRVKIVSLTALPSVTVDTGVLLWYHLWQPVGHALTWKLLDAFMSKVLHQLLLRPTSDGALIIRLGTIGGEAPSYEGVVAVNHDGYYKAWLVADGHLIVDHLESVDYSVVSMRSFQIVMFLPELNGLEFWSRDIGNAHLESNPDRETHILLISRAPQGQRALYDLKLSGQGWYDELHDCLVALGLLPCRAEPDIWMRKNGELQVWKYVVLYAIQHPRVSIGSLTPKLFEFKLKGIGKIRHHLKLQFSQDEDRTLRLGQKKYPKKITEGYVCFFGSRPRRNACAPLERGDHPEMDISPFLDEEKTKMYQSLIGALQWIITIGWFNIFPTLITMSFIQDTPRYRHFKKITRNHSCLSVVV